MSSIRVLIVDDHQVVLEGFVARLTNEASIDVVATANNGQQAIEAVAEHQPDVVLMDFSMPVMNGLEATKHLKQTQPDIKILMLTMHDNREYIVQVMEAGAMGYILKEISAEEMVNAIQTVYQGATYFCQTVTKTLFQPNVTTQPTRQATPLSRREEKVLALVSKGLSNKKIAQLLEISCRTVETHRQNIRHKLDIQSVAELAQYASKHGLTE
ncbi:response regulator transcription factor [Thaumasiovibrio subtropicus]|uniref:response regulator transcription factor n=1 Tax=Thaumasiovibrio subtropicus TaxID=1891207 RepID=UPI000B3547FD|nr:response regulator transcription factor [Thaumasiovibrio subtropicus]